MSKNMQMYLGRLPNCLEMNFAFNFDAFLTSFRVRAPTSQNLEFEYLPIRNLKLKMVNEKGAQGERGHIPRHHLRNEQVGTRARINIKTYTERILTPMQQYMNTYEKLDRKKNGNSYLAHF